MPRTNQYGCEVSRYVHLNPVRLKRFGLDKRAQQLSRAGLVERPPDAQQLAERLERLRGYRWSSYRAYLGVVSEPSWLEASAVLAMMGGGAMAQRRTAYRQYVEAAVREGLPESPWERAVGGLVLGGPAFVRRLERWLKGDEKEQPGLVRLQGRPTWEQVRKAVERVKGERWEAFRDRHGDWGRDLALNVARRHASLSLRELGASAGSADYRAVAQAVKRMGARLRMDKSLRQALRQVERHLPGNPSR